jgi:hypothetical protein
MFMSMAVIKINEGTTHSMLDSFTLHLIDYFRVSLQLYCSLSLSLGRWDGGVS